MDLLPFSSARILSIASRKPGNTLSGINLSEEPPNIGFVGFDEAKKSIFVFRVMSAADPQRKQFIHHRYDPAPILCNGFVGFKSLLA